MKKANLSRTTTNSSATDFGGSNLVSGLQIHFNFLAKNELVVSDKTQRDRLNRELATHIQAAIAIGDKHGWLCKMRKQPILESLPPEERAKLNADERTLLRKARHARNKLIDSHMRLVTRIATKEHRKASSRVEVLDLIQEGTFGLIRACEKFDPDRGFSFSTYAYRWIWQSVLLGLSREERLISLSSTKLNMIRQVEKGKLRPETPEEEAELRQLFQVYRFPLSLDWAGAKREDDQGREMMSELSDPSTEPQTQGEWSEELELKRRIQRTLERLPGCERSALEAEFCLGWFARFENKPIMAESTRYNRIEQRLKQWVRESGQAGAGWDSVVITRALVIQWYEGGLARARAVMEG